MNWRTNGDGMAIGGINTQAGLQIYMPTEHYDDVDVDGDIDTTGDYKQNGSSIFPVSVANGGTGQTSIPAFLNAISTEYTNETTSTATTQSKEYTVSGSGLVFAYCCIVNANSSGYGTTYAYIYKNGNVIAQQADRTDASTGVQVVASSSIFCKVQNGDKIKLEGYASKGGTGVSKTFRTRAVALGCTLS
jgi:hypothetical protein